MPEISRFFGIRIAMFFEEHNPPHFHAQYQNFKAIYAINTGARMEEKMPPKLEKVIANWAQKYRKELLENWELMKTEKTFKKIKGADR